MITQFVLRSAFWLSSSQLLQCSLTQCSTGFESMMEMQYFSLYPAEHANLATMSQLMCQMAQLQVRIRLPLSGYFSTVMNCMPPLCISFGSVISGKLSSLCIV